jgi:hypothetical protein
VLAGVLAIDKQADIRKLLSGTAALQASSDMPSVFLSHNHTDRQFARRLAAELKFAGVTVWVDEAEIRPGDSLLDRLEFGLRETDYLAVLLSPEAVASRWVRVELNAALQMEVRGGRVKVIPILVRPCDIPTFLLDKIYVDFSGASGYYDSAAQLTRFILGAPPPVWISGKEAARLVKLQNRPYGALISLSQQGVLQQYIMHGLSPDARLDWLYSDAKSGRSRIWIVDFFDPSDSTVYPFGVRDGKVTAFPDATLHNAPPPIDFNFLDSETIVPIGIEAAQTAGHVPTGSDEFFVTTKLNYWHDKEDYFWSLSVMDVALSRATCGVVVSARTGGVVSCERP